MVLFKIAVQMNSSWQMLMENDRRGDAFESSNGSCFVDGGKQHEKLSPDGSKWQKGERAYRPYQLLN